MENSSEGNHMRVIQIFLWAEHHDCHLFLSCNQTAVLRCEILSLPWYAAALWARKRPASCCCMQCRCCIRTSYKISHSAGHIMDAICFSSPSAVQHVLETTVRCWKHLSSCHRLDHSHERLLRPLSVTGVSQRLRTCNFCKCSDSSWRPPSPNWNHRKQYPMISKWYACCTD